MLRVTPPTVERCGACGYAHAYHRQEPAYYGAERLEPGLTQSAAERDRDCPGWLPVEMPLAYAMALRGRRFCPSCRSAGFEPREGKRALGRGCEFCVETP